MSAENTPNFIEQALADGFAHNQPFELKPNEGWYGTTQAHPFVCLTKGAKVILVVINQDGAGSKSIEMRTASPTRVFYRNDTGIAPATEIVQAFLNY